MRSTSSNEKKKQQMVGVYQDDEYRVRIRKCDSLSRVEWTYFFLIRFLSLYNVRCLHNSLWSLYIIGGSWCFEKYDSFLLIMYLCRLPQNIPHCCCCSVIPIQLTFCAAIRVFLGINNFFPSYSKKVT